jgi:hypothetical protein
LNNLKVTVHLNTAVLDVFGDGRRKESTQGSPLKGVRIRNTQVCQLVCNTPLPFSYAYITAVSSDSSCSSVYCVLYSVQCVCSVYVSAAFSKV